MVLQFGPKYASNESASFSTLFFFLHHTVLQGNVKSCKMLFKVSSMRSIDLRSIEFSESDLNCQ